MTISFTPRSLLCRGDRASGGEMEDTAPRHRFIQTTLSGSEIWFKICSRKFGVGISSHSADPTQGAWESAGPPPPGHKMKPRGTIPPPPRGRRPMSTQLGAAGSPVPPPHRPRGGGGPLRHPPGPRRLLLRPKGPPRPMGRRCPRPRRCVGTPPPVNPHPVVRFCCVE